MLRKVPYVAFVAILLHVILLLSTNVSVAKLAGSLGLILDILGASLLVTNLSAYMRAFNVKYQAFPPPEHVTERIAVKLASLFNRRRPQTSKESDPAAYTAIVWGLFFLLVGFFCQWLGVVIPGLGGSR
jgi:hypothetical protein